MQPHCLGASLLTTFTFPRVQCRPALLPMARRPPPDVGDRCPGAGGIRKDRGVFLGPLLPASTQGGERTHRGSSGETRRTSILVGATGILQAGGPMQDRTCALPFGPL